MPFALGPALLDGLRELPGEEALAEAGGDGLRLAGAVVVAEAEVGEAERLGEHPAVAVVRVAEGGDPLLAVAAVGGDDGFEVAEGGEGEDGVPQLGVLLLVDAPEALRVERPAERLVAQERRRVVAVAEDPREVVEVEAVELGDDGVEEGAEAEALVRGDGDLQRGLGLGVHGGLAKRVAPGNPVLSEGRRSPRQGKDNPRYRTRVPWGRDSHFLEELLAQIRSAESLTQQPIKGKRTKHAAEAPGP